MDEWGSHGVGVVVGGGCTAGEVAPSIRFLDTTAITLRLPSTKHVVFILAASIAVGARGGELGGGGW